MLHRCVPATDKAWTLIIVHLEIEVVSHQKFHLVERNNNPEEKIRDRQVKGI